MIDITVAYCGRSIKVRCKLCTEWILVRQKCMIVRNGHTDMSICWTCVGKIQRPYLFPENINLVKPEQPFKAQRVQLIF